MTTFSVIVPIYKVERYIKDCIESILAQTFNDFEILCVDDCGGDDSIRIVEELAKEDKRIKILYHKKNKGVSAARNLALDNASGKYVLCVDSDDLIDPNTLELLLEAFQTSNSNSVWFNGYRYYENGKTQRFQKELNGYIDLNPHNIATFSDIVSMKAYLLDSIKKIDLHWSEELAFDEDGEFFFKYYAHYNTVFAIPNCLYYLRQREGSAVNNFLKGKTSCKDLFQVILNLANFYKKQNIYDKYKITILKLLENRLKMFKDSSNTLENKKLALKMLMDLNFEEEYLKYKKDYETLVSVVVPIYNVEQYVKQCVLSIMNQTYKNIEILCIDDCGQDNSIKIVEELAKKDSRIKIIRHEKNKGLGGARTTGLNLAKGEFILFIDSDDWIEPDCVASCAQKLELTGVDSVWFKFDHYHEHTSQFYPMTNCLGNMNEGYYNIDETNISHYSVVTWNKAYRTKFLRENNLSWREKIIYEDLEFYWRAYTTSTRIYVIDRCFYHYRQRQDSIMHVNDNFIYKLKVHIRVLLDIYEYLKEQNLLYRYKEAFLGMALFVLSTFESRIPKKDFNKEKLDFLKKIEDIEYYQNYKFEVNGQVFFIKDVRAEFYRNQKILDEIVELFLDNIIQPPTSSTIKDYLKNSKNFNFYTSKKLHNQWYDNFNNSIRKNNSIFLMITDIHNNIIGAINSNECDFDKNVIYLDTISILPEYRRLGLASILMNRILEMSKNNYEQAIGVILNNSKIWTDSMEFSILEPVNKRNKKLIASLKARRPDYPEFATFITKNLN